MCNPNVWDWDKTGVLLTAKPTLPNNLAQWQDHTSVVLFYNHYLDRCLLFVGFHCSTAFWAGVLLHIAY